MFNIEPERRGEHIHAQLSLVEPGICLKASNLEVWVASQPSGSVGCRNTHQNLEEGQKAKEMLHRAESNTHCRVKKGAHAGPL